MPAGILQLLTAGVVSCVLSVLGALVHGFAHGPHVEADEVAADHSPAKWVPIVLVGIAIGIIVSVVALAANVSGFSIAVLTAAALAGYVGADLFQAFAGRKARTERLRRTNTERIDSGTVTRPERNTAPAADINLSFDENGLGPKEPEPDPRAVGMFFATNRGEVGPTSEGTFTGERADRIASGKAFVRVPETHRLGKVELPMRIRLLSYTLYEQTRDPSKHFVLRAVQMLAQDEWCRQIAAFPSDTALVFVHGFSTSFEEALFRNAQILWDLKFRGVSVVFSWPSRGRVPDYKYDIDSAMGARKPFIHVLQLLAAQPNLKRIHVLAHSMGNLLVLDALANHRHDAAPLSLGELMMAAPDVDRDLYRSLAAPIRKATRGMTLYASSADKALMLSKRAAGNIPRAGDVPADGPVLVPEVDAIDVTAIGDELFGLNHTVFAQTRSILNDVGLLIGTGTRPPDVRLAEIRPVPEGTPTPRYWRYAP